MSRGILFAKMNFEGWGEVGGAGESQVDGLGVDGLGVWKGKSDQECSGERGLFPWGRATPRR